MRKSYTHPLGDVIKEYMRVLGIDKKLKEVNLIKQWENIMGKTINNSTSKLYIYNKILFVYIASPIIRNELYMLKQGIITALNEKAGEEIITDIVFRIA